MSHFRGPRIRATKSPNQYPYMQYGYQNIGTQLTWRDSPPYRTRGADAAALGSYLPVPGGPEQIPIDSGYSGVGDCGCGCKGAGTCRQSMGGIIRGGRSLAGIELEQLAKPAAILAGAYLLFKMLKKRRR